MVDNIDIIEVHVSKCPDIAYTKPLKSKNHSNFLLFVVTG